MVFNAEDLAVDGVRAIQPYQTGELVNDKLVRPVTTEQSQKTPSIV